MIDPQPRLFPLLGCLTLLGVLCLMCLLPIVLVDTMRTAIERLHLTPAMATLAVVGIFVGGLFNIPVYRIERDQWQPVMRFGPYGYMAMHPAFRAMRRDTIVAINVGGCLIPVILALWQIPYVYQSESHAWTAMLVISAVNIAACYLAARPVAGIGIAMPGFLSPLVCVGMTWILLGDSVDPSLRAPVAFTAGVAGPLIGADLMHLRDITRVSVGMLSIGGAGTFDGIVLSSILAALLA